MTLYEVLGVDKDVTDKALLKAFRKKARETHPDRGGTNEDFQRVEHAYVILSNPEKRARYDATGDEGSTIPDNTETNIQVSLHWAFRGAMKELVQWGANVKTHDMIEKVRSVLLVELRAQKNNLTNITKARDAMTEVLGRIEESPDLVNTVTWERNKLDEDKRPVEERVRYLTMAVERIKNAKYRMDKAPTTGNPPKAAQLLQGGRVQITFGAHP